MSHPLPEEVDPTGRDLREFTDALRPQHVAVRNARGEYVFLRHADVRAIALDDETFSSAVSAHLQIPNGLDGAEHTAYRRALDVFLTPAALEPYHAVFERIAAGLASELPLHVALDAVGTIGARFAVRAQSAWLGWPTSLEQPLVDWVARNHEATRSGNRTAMVAVADEFDGLIRSVLEPRRGEDGQVVGDDVTAELMRTQVDGRPLREEEIVSVLRNWTGGDLGSIALCVGVLLYHLAEDAALADRLRAGVSDAELDAVINEILRIDDPFVTNRRITTCPVTVSGVELPEGARVKINWTSANRDEAVFGDPDAFDPAGNAADNLVYGIGRHACPGEVLATIELRIALRAILAATSSITLAEETSTREMFPVGGWSDVHVILS